MNKMKFINDTCNDLFECSISFTINKIKECHLQLRIVMTNILSFWDVMSTFLGIKSSKIGSFQSYWYY